MTLRDGVVRGPARRPTSCKPADVRIEAEYLYEARAVRLVLSTDEAVQWVDLDAEHAGAIGKLLVRIAEAIGDKDTL